MSTTFEQDEQINCSINFDEMCRICFTKLSNLTTIHDLFENNSIVERIMACASVQIDKDDGFPQKICNKCSVMLNIAYEFKKICEATDLRLKQHVIQSSDLYLDSNVSNDECDNNNLRTKVRKKKLPIVHQCDTCGKSFNRREYLTQHIRIHTGEKPYSCKLCEKRFTNSGHLTTHMRTHTGIKPHTCNICPKAFSTKQELIKHLMVHRGDRPYSCYVCNKKFGSSSNMNTHMKHHTGEKNFTCEQCGKAFYTKQELKQHFVIHTGEKPFVCQICSKRFSQIAHVQRHIKRVHKT